jgi:hypothetical protein
MQPVKDGHQSSEWKRSRRAGLMGEVMAGLGTAVAVAGGWLGRHVLAAVGLALAAFGVVAVGWALHAYASSRGRVKAAASAPPARMVGRGV